MSEELSRMSEQGTITRIIQSNSRDIYPEACKNDNGTRALGFETLFLPFGFLLAALIISGCLAFIEKSRPPWVDEMKEQKFEAEHQRKLKEMYNVMSVDGLSCADKMARMRKLLS